MAGLLYSFCGCQDYQGPLPYLSLVQGFVWVLTCHLLITFFSWPLFALLASLAGFRPLNRQGSLGKFSLYRPHVRTLTTRAHSRQSPEIYCIMAIPLGLRPSLSSPCYLIWDISSGTGSNPLQERSSSSSLNSLHIAVPWFLPWGSHLPLIADGDLHHLTAGDWAYPLKFFPSASLNALSATTKFDSFALALRDELFGMVGSLQFLNVVAN